MIILLYSTNHYGKNEGLFVKIAGRVLDIWLDMSSGPKWPKCIFWVPDPKVKKFFEISFYWIHLMILEKIMAYLWKLKLGLWSYGLNGKSSGPKWPKCSFRVPDTKVKKFFEISWFYWIHLVILEKIMACFWKLKLGFWTYGLIRLLGPSGRIVVTGSQTSRSRNFLRFHDFIGFISWFLRKWDPVCENCS